jgi:hypothetical protein
VVLPDIEFPSAPKPKPSELIEELDVEDPEVDETLEAALGKLRVERSRRDKERQHRLDYSMSDEERASADELKQRVEDVLEASEKSHRELVGPVQALKDLTAARDLIVGALPVIADTPLGFSEPGVMKALADIGNALVVYGTPIAKGDTDWDAALLNLTGGGR